MTQEQYTPVRNAEDTTATQPNGNKVMPSALLPRDILAGREFQQGDEVHLRIVNVFEDELEVALLGARSGKAKSMVMEVSAVMREAARALEQLCGENLIEE